MGFTSLEPDIDPQDYEDWLKDSDEGRQYGDMLQRQYSQGLSVSHMPPADKIRQWKSQRAQPNMQAYRPGAAQPIPAPSQGSPYMAYAPRYYH